MLVAATLLVPGPGAASAQVRDHIGRTATSAEVLGGNVLLGGVTAATRALLSRKDPFKAFGVGALGGVVFLAGKDLAVEGGALRGWAGLAVASAGRSMISNAGRGASPFDELSVPIVATRVRFTPRNTDKVRIAVNGFESAVLIGAAFTRGLEIDWPRTASSGAAVFGTRDLRLVGADGEEFDGWAWAPVVVIGAFARDPSRTMRHEVIHVQQDWFMQEAWGRPIEDYSRSRMPGARFIPRWLELGVAAPALHLLEGWLPGRSGIRALQEAEAYRLERR